MKLAGNIVVFWTVLDDPSAHMWIAQELERGRLRQGWGVDGFQLKDGSSPLPMQVWTRHALAGARKSWAHEEHTDVSVQKRFKILKRLLNLRQGDQIVVPHMPGRGFITLATVSSPYRFDHELGYSSYPWDRDNLDFGHVIGVDRSRLVAIPFNTCDDSIHVTSQFSYYRSAVNMVRNPIHQAAVTRLFEKHVR